MPEVENELAKRVGLSEEVVLGTVVRLDGRPPSRTGAKILANRSAALAGTLGCSEFDSAAVAEAAGLLETGEPALRTFRHDLGAIEVYLEPYLAAPVLAVLGATPVAEALGKWAGELGFAVRHELPELAPRELYVVHTNHDAPGLVGTLERALQLQPRFLGLMGSKRHTGHHLEALRERGMAEEDITRIQSPVGLDIGAQTAPEIALAILAGLVAIRRGGGPGWL